MRPPQIEETVQRRYNQAANEPRLLGTSSDHFNMVKPVPGTDGTILNQTGPKLAHPGDSDLI
jgi:hypothetical protein